MDHKWLDDFLVLARTRNFSKAAEERHVTQSAFSRRIQALELWLGAPLIDRSTYPTTLTTEGHLFRERAEEITHLLYTARADVLSKAQSKKYAVSFSILHSLALTFYPKWIKVIEDIIGQFNTKVLPDNFHNCVQAIAEGGYDFLLTFSHPAISIMLDPHLYKSMTVGIDQLIAVGTPDLLQVHQAHHEKSRPLPLLGYARDTFLGRLASIAQEQNGAWPVRVGHTNDMAEGLKFMALEGHGIAWLPHSLVREELDGGKLASIGNSLPMTIKLYGKAGRGRHIVEHLWRAAESVRDPGYADLA